MKNNIYWIDNDYPFEIHNIIRDTDSTDDQAMCNATRIGISAIKAEIYQRELLVDFIENNNDWNGGQLFSTIYINSLKQEIFDIIEAFPEETI